MGNYVSGIVVRVAIALLIVGGLIYGLTLLGDGAVDEDEKKKSVEKSSEVGLSAFQKGDFKTAIEEFESAAEASPDDPEVQRLLGQSYEAFGDLGKAKTAYQASLKAEPDQYEVVYRLAIAHKSEGNVDAAIRGLRQSTTLKEDFVGGIVVLGDLYAEEKKYDLAVFQYEKLVELEPFGIEMKEIKSKLKKWKKAAKK